MKKIISLFILTFSILLFSNDIFAYSLNFSASANTVYVGDTVAVTATLNSIEGKFIITSSNNGVLNGGKETDWLEGGSVSAYFTAQSVGTATITLKPIAASTMDPGNEQDFDEPRYVTINVIARPTQKPIDINKTYSSNNYLSSLCIDGYEIEFDKDTLEYSIELDSKVEKINVVASVEDESAKVNGIGEIEVSEGSNTINVVVTAENGNERTYIINALVKELNPINVKIDKEKYTIVKKESLLPTLDGYQLSTIMINDQDIPVLKGDITDYILVGLKDKKGNIELYIYNQKENTYSKYNEISFNKLKLYFMENKDNNYKSMTIKINGKTINVYKKNGLDYYLIYGMNLDTGETNWYTYDQKENTIQRYIDTEDSNNKTEQYLFLIIILSSCMGLLIVFSAILLIKNKSKKIVL